MKFLPKIAGFFLALAILATSACAETTPELSQLMENFMEENGLNQENFSCCYYNTVTGEEYRFNDTKMMTAASTFKLPLNLYYYEKELNGEIDPNTTIQGVPLSALHRESLVNSNNEYSMILLYNLGSFSTYKTAMGTYFSTPDSEIESKYYHDNYYCTEMMMDTLTYLYENQEKFPQMIDYMKEAQPTQWFASTKSDYEIAHKYGFYDGAVNDVGIIYTENPFLLAVYTKNLNDGEGILGDTCALLTDYTVSQWEAEEQIKADALAAQQAEADRMAAEKAEAEKLAAQQVEAEKAAAEQLKAEQLATQEAEKTVAEAVMAKAGTFAMTAKDYVFLLSCTAIVFGLGGCLVFGLAGKTAKKATESLDSGENQEEIGAK